MSEHIVVEIEIPVTLQRLKLPLAVNQRLQELLDRQDWGEPLTEGERQEAEGLVNITSVRDKG